jgi:MoaA/NifB/PqqE/SkfB family radical SAM enzyme
VINIYRYLHKYLGIVRNNIVKIIPENSFLFKWMTIIGLKINARSCHIPLTSMRIGVYATEHCNLNCRCCTAFSPLADKTFLNIDTYRKDIEKIAELTHNNLDLFYITGGEPLLHPQISDIIIIADQYFPKTAKQIFTNGILLLNMPDLFWETCQKTKIQICLSRYPIKLDIDQIRSKAKAYNVSFDFFGGRDVPIKLMWKYPLDLEGKQSLRRSYNLCTQINTCVTLKDGKIYPCNTIAGIKHFNKYFNAKLEVISDDVLDIYKVEDINEVYSFLARAKHFCRYCNRRGIVLGIPYGSSKKEITEWT